MAAPEIMIAFYNQLPSLIEERSDIIEAKNNEPDFMDSPFHEGDIVSSEAMTKVDNYAQPSSALCMHMAEIENTLFDYRIALARKEFDKTVALKSGVIEALLWFKRSFIGKLYSEIDASEIGLEKAVIESVQQALSLWFTQIEMLAGETFNLPEEAGLFNDAQVHMFRIQAAHERMSASYQMAWLSHNAFNALVLFQIKVQNIKRINARGFSEEGTAASVSPLELIEYRNLYKRFQSFLTHQGSLNQAEVPVNLDSELCYFLEGKSKDKTAFTSDNQLAWRITSGLGPLGHFKHNEQGGSLKKVIQKRIDTLYIKAQYPSLVLHGKELNPINELFNLAEHQESNSFCFSSLAVHSYKCEFNLPEPTVENVSAKTLFLLGKKIKNRHYSFLFATHITDKLLTLFGLYCSKDYRSISSVNQNIMCNYLHLFLGLLIEDTSDEDVNFVRTTLVDIRKIILGAEGFTSYTGNDCIERLEKVKDILSCQIGKNRSLLIKLDGAFTDVYESEIHSQDLIEGTPFNLFQDDNRSLSKEISLIETEILFSFNYFSKALNSQIDAQTKNYNMHSLFNPLSRSYLSCTSEIYTHLLAKNIWDNLKEAAREGLLYKSLSQEADASEHFLKSVERVKLAIDLFEELSDFPNAPSILSSQLAVYFSLLSHQLPCIFTKKTARLNFKKEKLSDSIYKTLPLDWLKWLSNSDDFFGEYESFEILKNDILKPALTSDENFLEVQAFSKNELKKMKQTSEELDKDNQIDEEYRLSNIKLFLGEKIPSLLATSAIFEVRHNLKPGVISDFLYPQINQFHLGIIEDGIIGLSKEQHYDLENLPHYTLNAKKLFYKKFLTPLEDEISDQNQKIIKLTEFLTLLEQFHSFWLRSNSNNGIGALIGRGLSYVMERHDADYLICMRNIRTDFLALRIYLAEYNISRAENFLEAELSFNQNIQTLITDTQKTLLELEVVLAEGKKRCSRANGWVAYYDKKNDDFLSVDLDASQSELEVVPTLSNKKERLKKLLEHMVEEMVANQFTITIEEGKVKFPAAYKDFIENDIQFGQVLYVRTLMACINLKKKSIVKVILEEPELLAKPAKEVVDYMQGELKDEFQKQIDKTVYYIQANKIKRLVEEFDAYLENPQLCTENDTTTGEKLFKLKKLSEVLDLFDASKIDDENLHLIDIEKRFEAIKNNILATDGGKGFREALMEDINPNPLDYKQVVPFITYWLMRLFRELQTIITQRPYSNKREELANAFIDDWPITKSSTNEPVKENDPPKVEGFTSLYNAFTPFWPPSAQSSLPKDVLPGRTPFEP